jgi:hypothetical protein
MKAGFWVVAVYADRVLWFNDIEWDFNVSTFKATAKFRKTGTGATTIRFNGRYPI